MIDVKCKNCNKVLAKATVIVGAIKCPRCKMIFEYKEFENIQSSTTYTPTKHLHVCDDSDIIQSEPPEFTP